MFGALCGLGAAAEEGARQAISQGLFGCRRLVAAAAESRCAQE